MKVLSNLIFFLLFFSFFISCNKNNNKISKKESIKVNNQIKKVNSDIAFLKGDVNFKNNMLKEVFSKLKKNISSLPKDKIALIESLKLENLQKIYFVINKEKIYFKIDGLDISKVVSLIDKKQEYKKFKNLKYFIKDKIVIATDGKISYAARGISIEDITTYDMNPSVKLNSLINESKNNGFLISFYEENIAKSITKSSSPFFTNLKSLKGASLYSSKEQLNLLIKLDSNDAKVFAENLNKIYQAQLPMVLAQLNYYENIFLKKDLQDKEKVLLKTLFDEFKVIAKSIKVDSKDENLFVTMKIKSLESAVSLVGMLAAVAIPAYQGYIKKSRLAALKDNLMAANMLIKNELSKGDSGDTLITNDVVKLLNTGNKRSPFNQESPAFKVGDKSVPYGSIVISKTNLRDIKKGETITIYAPNYNKKINFHLENIIITK